jgi:hypothetical protein
MQLSNSSVATQEAEAAQQRGERRTGMVAIPHLSDAVIFYREAMDMGLDQAEHVHAAVLCGEALQHWAAQVIACEATAPDEAQTAAREEQARFEARSLLQEAVQAGDHPSLCDASTA